MNANYSEALEKQLQLLRWWEDHETPCNWDTDSRLAEALTAAGMAVPKVATPAIRSMLKFGSPYYWGGNQCDLLLQVSKSVPRSAAIDLTMFDMAGFHWFAKPLAVSGNQWSLLGIAYVRTYRGIEFAAWEDWRHNGTLESDPDVYGYWPYGVPIAEMLPHPVRDDPQGRAIYNMCWNTLFAGAMFLQQRILIAPMTEAERHARKRLADQGWQGEPLIRVVQLRRREHIGGKQAVESIDREWSCQWVVRGHWRQQLYPKVGAVRPKWITPYVKGPDDKPLKPPRATVFAVVR